MATIPELIEDYRSKGWSVDETTLTLVSKVDDMQKYDVNVVSPDNVFGTAQIIESPDGAIASGIWAEQKVVTKSFPELLTDYVRSLETGDVFAVVIGNIFQNDNSAIATKYTGTTTVAEKQILIKYRNNAFSVKEIA